MRRARRGSGLKELPQSVESEESLLLLLLLLLVRLPNKLRRNYDLRNRTVIRDRKGTRSVLLYTESNAVQIRDHRYPVHLLLCLRLSNRYSKGRGKSTVPKNKLEGVLPRRML